MKPTLYACFALACAVSTVHAWCSPDKEFCVNATLTDNDAKFTVQLTDKIGYAGIGFGKRQMEGADIIMITKSGTVKNFLGKSHRLASSPQYIQDVKKDGNNITFNRPVRTTVSTLKDDIDFIWSWSESEDIKKHDKFGTGTFSFEKAEKSQEADKDKDSKDKKDDGKDKENKDKENKDKKDDGKDSDKDTSDKSKSASKDDKTSGEGKKTSGKASASDKDKDSKDKMAASKDKDGNAEKSSKSGKKTSGKKDKDSSNEDESKGDKVTKTDTMASADDDDATEITDAMIKDLFDQLVDSYSGESNGISSIRYEKVTKSSTRSSSSRMDYDNDEDMPAMSKTITRTTSKPKGKRKVTKTTTKTNQK